MVARPGLYALAAAAVCAAAGFAAMAARDEARLPDAPAAAATLKASLVAEGGSRVHYPDGSQPRLILPDGQARTIQSVLRIEAPMEFGSYVWDDEGVPPGPVWVRVDVGRQLISVFRGGHEIGSAVILFGAESKPTPSGAFTVLQKAKDYHSRTYDAPMPFMLRLTADGVAIHASNVREGWATHGCIGTPEAFARQLFAEMQLGDAVFIVA